MGVLTTSNDPSPTGACFVHRLSFSGLGTAARTVSASQIETTVTATAASRDVQRRRLQSDTMRYIAVSLLRF